MSLGKVLTENPRNYLQVEPKDNLYISVAGPENCRSKGSRFQMYQDPNAGVAALSVLKTFFLS